MKKVMRLHSAISPASARALGGEGSPEIDFNPRNLLSTIFQVSTSLGEDCLFDTLCQHPIRAAVTRWNMSNKLQHFPSPLEPLKSKSSSLQISRHIYSVFPTLPLRRICQRVNMGGCVDNAKVASAKKSRWAPSRARVVGNCHLSPVKDEDLTNKQR